MPQFTVQQILNLALRNCGAFGEGDQPTSMALADALLQANFMIAEWQASRWMVYHLLDWSILSTGAEGYTVGPGQDFPCVERPDIIESAYVRLNARPRLGLKPNPLTTEAGSPLETEAGEVLFTEQANSLLPDGNLPAADGSSIIVPNNGEDIFIGSWDQSSASGPLPVDYPLKVFQSYEDYARVRTKALNGFPLAAYYDAGYPTGILRVWPQPMPEVYEIHILARATLGELVNLTDTINLPARYMSALFYNLAVRLQPGYGLSTDPRLVRLAQNALSIIKASNSQVADLKMPKAIGRRSRYNIYSDQGT